MTKSEDIYDWLQYQDKEFFTAGIWNLLKRWERCVNVKEDYTEI